MKATIIAAAFGAATLAAAQHNHHARHEQLHKREVVTAYVDQPEVLEEIVVYTDSEGKPVSTSTFYKTIEVTTSVAAAPTVAPSAAPTTVLHTESAPAVAPSAAPASSSAPAPSASASASSSGSSSGSSGPVGINGLGVSYSPYNADGSCKTAGQVSQDLASIDASLIRLYGTDCNQVSNVLGALQGKNTQIIAGIFNVGNAQNEAKTIISSVNGDWSKINTVSVGNEVVNDGGDPKTVTDAVGSTRSQLRSAGYQGPVVTVDTMVAMVAHPELCTASDYCAINCHAFFDGHTYPEGAGAFVLGWVQQIATQHLDKKVVVTESGWPSKGETNGVAVPSEQNQKTAIDSIKATFSSNMVLYSAYNDLWKTNTPAQFQAEQWWGINGMAPSA